ncbi:MAG TPA: universal stress protein [Gemmatimonadales bacterium]|nr:universal stress protein [Gemmatimonadales bacterium]
MPGIVVGVDGSDHSHRALIWAMQQAAQQHVPLTVLAVRPDPVRPVTGIYWGVHAYPEDAHNREAARKAIQQIVEQVRNEIGETAPQATVNVVTGDPAEELVNASRDASMVVVGSRGSDGFASLLMGSVSSKVAHHAACPVVVVRGEGQAA